MDATNNCARGISSKCPCRPQTGEPRPAASAANHRRVARARAKRAADRALYAENRGFLRKVESLAHVLHARRGPRARRRKASRGEHCLDKAYHTALQQLCQNIVQTQTEEMALMQSWLCAWYGICR